MLMLNKMLLTALVLMLSHTTVYALVDCDESVDCVPDAIFTIDGIDQLKARVFVGKIPEIPDPGITIPQECIPIDWVGTCKIDNLGGPGKYYAKVSFGVTAPLSRFHCNYKGYIEFKFDGTYQVVKKIPLSGSCYYFDDEPPPAKE
jgi:hypothetical protein